MSHFHGLEIGIFAYAEEYQRKSSVSSYAYLSQTPALDLGKIIQSPKRGDEDADSKHRGMPCLYQLKCNIEANKRIEVRVSLAGTGPGRNFQ